MKPLLCLRPPLIRACLAPALLLCFADVQAQPTSPAADPAPVTQENRSARPYVLDITGGMLLHKGQKTEATLANVVGVLRDLFPGANIVLAPELARMKIADLKLRSVEQLSEALEGLRVASGYRFAWRKGWPGGAVDPATGLPVSVDASSLYVLDLGTERDPLTQARRAVEVFNLSGYLIHDGMIDEKQSAACVQEIEHVVNQTLAMLKQGSLAEDDHTDFQFHPGASLLIVIGSPEALDVARKVVTALPGVSLPDARSVAAPRPGVEANPSADAFARRYGLLRSLRQPAPPASNPVTPGTPTPYPSARPYAPEPPAPGPATPGTPAPPR